MAAVTVVKMPYCGWTDPEACIFFGKKKSFLELLIRKMEEIERRNFSCPDFTI
jgi:hypothetical protein